MYPVILEIGPVTLYSYGLMMALGFLSAGYLTGLELDRKGYDGQIASSLLLWAAIGGIGGARLLTVACSGAWPR
jgi:phosphatidylglycerol:prolipoprotein diacylglycerol transferase